MGDRPNIVWITLESIRQDHTSLGGYQRDTTPRLKRLAKEAAGQSFSSCISHGKWTGTSSASILTGAHPATHGIFGASDRVLSDRVATLPELLPNEYTTLSLVSNPNAGPAKGLDRGFDDVKYVVPSTLRETVGYRTLAKSIPQLWKHGGGLTLDIERHKGLSSYMMADTASRFFSSTDEPQFLYLHLNSSHHTYLPPAAFLDRFSNDIPMSAKEALEITQSNYEDIHELIAHGATEDEWEAIEAMYDAVISHIDFCVDLLIKSIRERMDRKTIFVVVGDHGDLLGEHGLAGHKLVVDDALTHVPLVTHGLDSVKHHADRIIQPIDIIRTLFSLIGADDDQLEGIDLTKESRDYAVTQRSGKNGQKNMDRIKEINPSYELPVYHSGMLTAFRSTEFKYIHTDGRKSLFELPDESVDTSADYPDITAEFEEYAADWLANHEGHSGAVDRSEDLDADIQAHLSDMGYL